MPSEQYFDDELFTLTDEEIFCDCGSFNGDTLKQFLHKSNRKYKKYFAIEADPSNYNELLKTIEKEKSIHIYPINKACWSEKTVLKFNPLSSAGTINIGGSLQIQADSLDNLLTEESITFIKMDIEGAEQKSFIWCKENYRKKFSYYGNLFIP